MPPGNGHLRGKAENTYLRPSIYLRLITRLNEDLNRRHAAAPERQKIVKGGTKTGFICLPPTADGEARVTRLSDGFDGRMKAKEGRWETEGRKDEGQL